MSLFGPIITGNDVVNAVVNTIKTWGPDYLAEAAEHSGRPRNALPMFREFVRLIDLNKFNEDQVPTCVVIAPGLIDNPVKHGKQVSARWGVGIGCIVGGQSDDNTYELVTLYSAAVRLLMLQKQSLGDFAQGVTWISERYDPLPDIDRRTFGAGVLQFGVDVLNVANQYGGPVKPSADPTVEPGDWPQVETVVINVKRES